MFRHDVLLNSLTLVVLIMFVCVSCKESIEVIEVCESPPNALQDAFRFNVNYPSGLQATVIHAAEDVELYNSSGEDVASFQAEFLYEFIPVTTADTTSNSGIKAKAFLLDYGNGDVDTIQYSFELEYEPECSRGYLYTYQRVSFNDSLYYEDSLDPFPPSLNFQK